MDDINDHYILYNQSELIITKCYLWQNIWRTYFRWQN